MLVIRAFDNITGETNKKQHSNNKQSNFIIHIFENKLLTALVIVIVQAVTETTAPLI